MKLSIITVNYNNKAGLQKTIDSVVCQTWRDFEWIVIDGGSTDGSKELIEQYQQHFAYWCSEPDKGVYNAMNKGISKAKGEYLNFMNSGDCFYNEYSLSYFHAVYNPSIDVFYADADFIDEKGCLVYEMRFPDKIIYQNSGYKDNVKYNRKRVLIVFFLLNILHFCILIIIFF